MKATLINLDNRFDTTNLTLGKVYDVERDCDDGFCFKDDAGMSRWGYANRFKVMGHPQVVQKLDAVNHPAHYGGADNPFEAIKVIEAWQLDFNLGNTVKYVSRAGKKSRNAVEDLKKAAWYLNREIDNLSKGQQ